jgi:AmiR/NasT family two-component response regulator
LARDRSVLAEQLQSALNSRVAIEQAKGALSNQLGVGVDQAFLLLRDRARSTRRRLLDVAEAVVRGDADWQPSAPSASTKPEEAE